MLFVVDLLDNFSKTIHHLPPHVLESYNLEVDITGGYMSLHKSHLHKNAHESEAGGKIYLDWNVSLNNYLTLLV